jgi:hypothetical protein
MLAATLSTVSLSPISIDLDRLTIEGAWRLDGRTVLASFISAKDAYFRHGRVIIGAVDQPDGAERWATLGWGRDVVGGQRVAVVGVLLVTEWPSTYVGGVLIPGWVDIHVRER